MITTIRPSRALFAAALIALGVTGLVNGDFALSWQRIPLHDLPGRTVIAYACALIELATGIGLLLRPTLVLSCRVLAVYLLLWLVLLKLPVVLKHPEIQESWAGFGEIAIIAAAGWCLFASNAGAWEQQHLKPVVGASGIRAARVLLIVALPMIGLDVLVHAYTLPPWLRWLPVQRDWIYLSGLGSLAAGLGLLLGVFPRLAATMEAAMLGFIGVIFWAPVVYTGRTATTALVISTAIAAGVWVVADTYRKTPWLAWGQASRGISMD
jgi:uncharacterized membrane protein YphA (DoxX/SURF4 family)